MDSFINWIGTFLITETGVLIQLNFHEVFFPVTTTTTAKPTAAVSSFTSSSSSPSRSSVCSLSKHYGTCLTESIRFYHDPHSNSCRKFRYTGCGGNGNNFLSGEECVRTCGGVLDVSASASAPLTPTVILIFMKTIKKILQLSLKIPINYLFCVYVKIVRRMMKIVGGVRLLIVEHGLTEHALQTAMLLLFTM